MEIFYWKDVQHKEVDFVVKDGDLVKDLIQACWDLSRPQTREREISALVRSMVLFKKDEGIVITGEYEGMESIDGRAIKFIPLWKWLLVPPE
ncbi:MAG: ATP-binding protein [Deltaproteobacteria bacterium]|nr:ATP-binding protein [Deltaproteobacteria bacterium]